MSHGYSRATEAPRHRGIVPAVLGASVPRWLVVLAVAALVPGLPVIHAQQAPAQTPQAVFRSTTRLIVQTVTVKDKDGKALEGLTATDFSITEDGQPQDIAFVEYQRLEPAGTQAAAPAAPTVVPPVPPPGVPAVITSPPNGGIRYQNRRLIVIYFDTASMPPGDSLRAYVNAREYVDNKMAPADLIALMEYKGGAVRVRQDFTDDRNRLREVIQTMIYGEDQDGDGFPDNPELGTAFGQDDAEFNIFNTDRQLSALQTAIAMLRPLPEQKSLIYFASGIRLNGSDNQSQMRATVNAAIRANVTLNPIDARGLVATPPLGDASRRSPGGLGMFTGATAQQGLNNFQRSQDSLYALAKDTGGTAMFDYNDLSKGIVDAANALSSYYIIGYYSTHTAADGKFRRVKVTLNGSYATTADATYRQGYYADKTFANFNTAEKERQLEDALMLEDPITEIPIALEVNFFQLNRAEYFVPVAVKIPGSELALAKRRGATRTLIDFIGEVKDENGYTQQNVRDKLDIKLPDDVATQFANRPVQYETGFTLLPGKYVIKLLARDSETGRIGTYQTSFVIPNLEREDKRVPISTVVLSSQRVPLGDELFTVKKAEAAQVASPLVADGEKLIPSVTRVFSKSRDLYIFLQSYQRRAATMQPLVAFVSFYRGADKAFETQPIAVTDGMDPKTKAIPLRFSVPLADFPTGRYDCQVTVLDPQGQKAAFWQAPIVVVP
jgi:VWFA-related protein